MDYLWSHVIFFIWRHGVVLETWSSCEVILELCWRSLDVELIWSYVKEHRATFETMKLMWSYDEDHDETNHETWSSLWTTLKIKKISLLLLKSHGNKNINYMISGRFLWCVPTSILSSSDLVFFINYYR